MDQLPPRIVRFRLRLNRYDYSIHDVAGKELHTADALSRAPLRESNHRETNEVAEIEKYVEMTTSTLPASGSRLDKYCQAQRNDEICRQVIEFCGNGWPQRQRVKGVLSLYWKERGSLTMNNGLLMYNDRIVIPQSLQKETMMNALYKQSNNY